jgi:hypothetical protein
MSKIYLLSGLAQAQTNELKQAGVEYAAWDDNTISIEEKFLKQSLQLLHANGSESATEFQDVIQLTLRTVSQEQSIAPTGRVLTPAQKQSRENYITACSKRTADLLQAAKQALNKHRSEFPDQVESFISAKRDFAFYRSELTEEALAKAFSADFECLCQVAKVRDVRLTSQAILVHTETLYATARDTNARHEVGKFLIVIDIDGRNGGIRWFNASRRVNALRPGMNAPNVYEDGTAYQDDLTATFYELLARLQFATLTDLAIQFIEEVTNDDLAKMIGRWPLAAEGDKS